jgi:peptidoglycan/LPS O-acetylase OafA/YrhL
MLDKSTTIDLVAAPALHSKAAEVVVPAKVKERFLYIDNLRLLMIIFVVMVHAAVTYSGLGSWYYKEAVKLDPVQFSLFGVFEGLTQGYFMGLLFLIAGYFVPGAYDKKGFGRFIRDRLVRLGIPTLIYMFLVRPMITFVLLDFQIANPKPTFLESYAGYITTGNFLSGTGPLWFALALLIFSLIYALVRLASGTRPAAAAPLAKKIGMQQVVLLSLIISVGAFAIRLVQPIGTDVMNMQLCYFTQYIVLFIVGIAAYRQGWFSSVDYSFGRKLLRAALTWGLLLFAAIMFGGGVVSNGMAAFGGGWHWQSAAFALWESFTAVAMSIGLLTVFREKYNHQNKLIKVLSDNSFAVYVFHAPVLIGISLLMAPVTLIPIAKFMLVAMLAVSAAFALTYFILRRVPVLNKVI